MLSFANRTKPPGLLLDEFIIYAVLQCKCVFRRVKSPFIAELKSCSSIGGVAYCGCRRPRPYVDLGMNGVTLILL
jgi:hypothetical protein